MIDAETGAEIFGKDADEIRAIASTTKIFVAMAVREKGLDLDGWTEITKADARQAAGGARTRLDVGEKFRNKDLLRAMLMASDNRAPTALGRAAGHDSGRAGRRDERHREATSTSSARSSPIRPGLRGNVSTAREMAIALRAALADDVLRAIMGDDVRRAWSRKGGQPRIDYGTTNQPLRREEVRRDRRQDRLHRGRRLLLRHRARGSTGDEVVMAFLGADGKLTRFADFNRVAAWIERGAPGAKVSATPASATSAPKLDVDGDVRAQRRRDELR